MASLTSAKYLLVSWEEKYGHMKSTKMVLKIINDVLKSDSAQNTHSSLSSEYTKTILNRAVKHKKTADPPKHNLQNYLQ